MDTITLAIVVVFGVCALAAYVWYRVSVWHVDHPTPKEYECEPATCNHDWHSWTEEVEMITDYNSYGASDTIETWAVTHYACPKCGSSYIEYPNDPLDGSC